MKAIDYFKTKARMTKDCEIDCCICPLNNGDAMGLECGYFEQEHPEKAIAIVKKWGEENPAKTYMQDFLEKFPSARVYVDTKRPRCCRNDIYGGIRKDCNDIMCHECWNEEMP